MLETIKVPPFSIGPGALSVSSGAFSSDLGPSLHPHKLEALPNDPRDPLLWSHVLQRATFLLSWGPPMMVEHQGPIASATFAALVVLICLRYKKTGARQYLQCKHF